MLKIMWPKIAVLLCLILGLSLIRDILDTPILLTPDSYDYLKYASALDTGMALPLTERAILRTPFLSLLADFNHIGQ